MQMSATGRCMHTQNIHMNMWKQSWCGVLSPSAIHRMGLSVSVLRLGSVCAKFTIATEAGPLEETEFVLAASAPPAGNKPSFLPFFLHPRTILKGYPSLEGLVIVSFTLTTFNCSWGDWIPLLLHFLSLWGTKAKITFFVWIFFHAQM